MKYQKLKILIEQFEQFEEETGRDDLTLFAEWLLSKKSKPEHTALESSKLSTNVMILQAIATLSNHAKHYIKTLTKGTPLVGWNDLIVLIVLYYGGDLRKTEVLQRSIIELSSGIEVINRLLRLKLVKEFPDPDDRRAKKISISAKGKRVIDDLSPDVDLAAKVVAGNLDKNEKRQLVPILQKLVHFHAPIFQEDLGRDIPSLVEKYVTV
ncbi:MAG: MarR family winged helix-turn-helix transcriptional regulator [Bacteroidota bacterium]